MDGQIRELMNDVYILLFNDDFITFSLMAVLVWETFMTNNHKVRVEGPFQIQIACCTDRGTNY